MAVVLSGYHKAWLRTEVVEDPTTSAVVIPRRITYAGIAHLPVRVGLYLAIVPELVSAFVGDSLTVRGSWRSRRKLFAGYDTGYSVQFSRTAAGGKSL